MIINAILFSLFALFRTAISRSMTEASVAAMTALLTYFPGLSLFEKTFVEEIQPGGSIGTWTDFLQRHVIPNVGGALGSILEWVTANSDAIEKVSVIVLAIIIIAAIGGVAVRLVRAQSKRHISKLTLWKQITSDLVKEEAEQLQRKAKRLLKSVTRESS